MATAITDSITTIDGHYNYAGRAAAFLIQDGDEAAFVDTVTRFSTPHLMQALQDKGLKPEQVRYIIVTHVHLDHSGGAAELAKHCPNATVIAHPRATRHIIDPSRLVQSAKPVYGEEQFEKLYGEIEPIDEKRVRGMDDLETLPLGSRTLTFLDAPGHARHHFAIEDSGTNSIFTGDAFGIFYPQLQHGKRPYINYVCAPPQFDPDAAKATIERIRDRGVDRAYLTHFGCCDHVKEGAEQLIEAVDSFDSLVNAAAETTLQDQELLDFCSQGALELMKNELKSCGLDPEDATVMKWATSEHMVSSQGLQVLAEQRRTSE